MAAAAHSGRQNITMPSGPTCFRAFSMFLTWGVDLLGSPGERLRSRSNFGGFWGGIHQDLVSCRTSPAADTRELPTGFPVMSHNAMSIPGPACWVMNGPPRMSRCERYTFCTGARFESGFRPPATRRVSEQGVAAGECFPADRSLPTPVTPRFGLHFSENTFATHGSSPSASSTECWNYGSATLAAGFSSAVTSSDNAAPPATAPTDAAR